MNIVENEALAKCLDDAKDCIHEGPKYGLTYTNSRWTDVTIQLCADCGVALGLSDPRLRAPA